MNAPISIWDVLGIAQTSDEKAIRRAYATRLKAINPDSDPQAFQRLRRAYEAALASRRPRVRVPSPTLLANRPAPVPQMNVTPIEAMPPPPETQMREAPVPGPASEAPPPDVHEAPVPDPPIPQPPLLAEQTHKVVAPNAPAPEAPSPEVQAHKLNPPVPEAPPIAQIYEEAAPNPPVPQAPPLAAQERIATFPNAPAPEAGLQFAQINQLSAPSPPAPKISETPSEHNIVANEFTEMRRGVDEALARGSISDAFERYDRAASRGALPIGMRDAVLEHIMKTVVSNSAIGSAEFIGIMQRVGWSNVPGRGERISRIRVAADQRLAAERWLQQLEGSKAKGREFERKNAFALLQGKRLWWLSPAGLADLKKKTAQLNHFRQALQGRVDLEFLARAEERVEWEEKWGGWVRGTLRVLLALLFLPFVIAIAFATSGAGAVPLVWVAIFFFRRGLFRRV